MVRAPLALQHRVSLLVVAVALFASCSATDDIHFFRERGAHSSGGDSGLGGEPMGGEGETGGAPPFSSERDVLHWPFSSESIWNMPLGEGAVLKPADLIPSAGKPITGNVSIVILKPDAPLTEIYQNSAGWSGNNRCAAEGELLFEVPVPSDYVVPDNRENNSLAALMPDGRTIRQAQPFARCQAGGVGTALVRYPDADLYGDGREGATGGSGLSSLGGTLRVGELRPNSGPLRHSLKISLDGANLMNCETADECFRWPAVRGDAGATNDYTGTNSELTMGSLLALPADLDSLNLGSEPGRILAQALAHYGGYVANQTGAPLYALSVEKGPDGDFMDQFESDWGMPFEGDPGSPWTDDVAKIFAALQVVTNNGSTSVGGGGPPLVPLAPQLTPP